MSVGEDKTASQPGSQAVPAANPSLPAPDSSNPPKTDLPRRKILIVDDDPVLVRLLSRKLESQGFVVVGTTDASQALESARKEKPDVMLLDVHFPPDVAHGGGVSWNGFVITQWLRRFEDARNTPVILISASDRADYKQKASDVGAAAFLPKPLDSNLLLASIQSALCQKPDADSADRADTRQNQDSKLSMRPVSMAPAAERRRASNALEEFGL